MAVLPINAQGQPREASLEDFERSAREKYEAAFDLLSRQYVGTGIYVMGYVAEITALTLDPETVFEDVSWMLAHHEKLWRK